MGCRALWHKTSAISSRDVGGHLDHAEVVLADRNDLNPPRRLEVGQGRIEHLRLEVTKASRYKLQATDATSYQSRRGRVEHLHLSREGGEPQEVGAVLHEVVHLELIN